MLEVSRDLEFAPLKNDSSAKNDTAVTCRESLSRTHKKYLKDIGAKFTSEEGLCEISPLLTYEGEGLESVKLPAEISLPLHIQ